VPGAWARRIKNHLGLRADCPIDSSAASREAIQELAEDAEYHSTGTVAKNVVPYRGIGFTLAHEAKQ
jgi:hypothetical protein